MKVYYFDNNATTRVDPAVFETIAPYYAELYGNPSSMHSFGGQVGRRIAEAREQIAALLRCQPSEIIFTSCGTEGDSTAVRSALEAQPEKRHIVSTRVEHPAVLNLVNHLMKRGYQVTLLGVDAQGMVDLDELRAALRDDTALVSIMYANNETGTLFPLPEIAEVVKSRGVLLHTDAVQAVGKIPVDLGALPVDFLVLSGHKLHAPKGVGAVFVRRGTPFRPFLIGGHQEKGRRGGTENVPGIIGLGKACELSSVHMKDENTRVRALRDRLEQRLVEAVPETRLNGHPTARLPNTVSLSFKYVEGEAILLLLDQLQICASSGSACTSGSLEPSHVLRAMGVPFTFAHGSIRFSLSRFNTEEEVDFVVEQTPKIIERLRAISPYSLQEREQDAPACTC
jgi:cysteine desulfurase